MPLRWGDTPPTSPATPVVSLRSQLADVTDRLNAARLELSELQLKKCNAETPAHLRCPISLQRMHSPVVVTDGHTFERRSIETWLTRNRTNPLTGAALESHALVPCLALRDAIRAWEMDHGRSPVQRPPTPVQRDDEDEEDENDEDEEEESDEDEEEESDEDSEAEDLQILQEMQQRHERQGAADERRVQERREAVHRAQQRRQQVDERRRQSDLRQAFSERLYAAANSLTSGVAPAAAGEPARGFAASIPMSVTVHGLSGPRGRTLNGRHGTVRTVRSGYDLSSQRVAVDVQGETEPLAIRPINLRFRVPDR